MVNILVGTLVSVADDVAQGDIIASALKSALASPETVCLSFKRVGSASSSFVSAALIPASRAMSFDEFKQRVRIVDASWQITDIIRRRVQLELVSAAWASGALSRPRDMLRWLRRWRERDDRHLVKRSAR
jgi:hypothetical protein